MSDPVFGTLLVPAAEPALARDLRGIRGWRVVTFATAEDGFEMAADGWTGYVDFATAPFPCLDAAAILHTEATAPQAVALERACGLPIAMRRLETPPGAAARAWLDDLAVGRFADMLDELAQSQAAAAAMRIEIDEMRTDFSLLESYLHRHDVPPLRKIWHAPYQEGTSLDVAASFAAALPCSSWGLTRLQLWIAAADPEASLTVELTATDTGDVLASWSIAPAQLDHRSGWLSFDLERSLSAYGQPLRLAVAGAGWRLGGSAPWLAPRGPDGEVATFAGPAMRVYATLPGVQGPQAVPLPTDDRRRQRLLDRELSRARALEVPADIAFSPVSSTDKGLLVHPVANAVMTATVDGACPALAVVARLAIRHDHADGEPFLVTLTPGTEADAESEALPPRAGEAGVIGEIGPVPAGTWVRLDSRALASIAFTMPPSPRPRPLHIATRTVEGCKPDLAWAIVTGVEFVLADG